MENKIIVPKNVGDILKIFAKNNFQIYIVGGAVRNLLLKKSVHNWDFTTNATPDQIQALFPESFYHNQYGTVTIKTTPPFEITPFRTESNYRDTRHPSKIIWAHTIEEDLIRRDFTINAIAFDGHTIIDPHDGIHDLKRKIVRAVGDPNIRFTEDALRLMRAIRIATELQCVLEEKTQQSIMRNAHLLKNISRERVRDELFKILKSASPAEGIMSLKNTGLLPFIIPKLHHAFDIPQKSPKRHHIYDVGTHSVKSLEACVSNDVIVRLATLLHDIGKVETFRKDPKTSLITFFNHEIRGAQIVKKIADDLRLSAKEKEKLYILVRYHQFTVSELQTDRAIRRFIREIGTKNLEDMLIVRNADRIGSGAQPTSWRYELFKKRLIEVQKQPFAIKDLKIDGNDVMKILKINPSPQVGEILRQIFDDVVEKKINNDKTALLKRIAHIQRNE
ncbi:MAG TPA: HD domain-containing protein [Patescibacteria group bacterium]|nr:HD domain-containing protein [Patescibacteria group bacterium]